MNIVALAEARSLAPAQLTGKTWKIKIIEGDRQGSSGYYPKEALEEGKGLFKKGIRIYENHPSSEEKWSQPERRVRDIIGYLSEDAEYDGKDLYANATFFSEHQEWVKERAEAGVIAMSIRAEGQMTESAEHGMELKKFTKVHSVDVVTVAGAGGKFDTLVESGTSSEATAEETQKEETELEISKEFIEALDKQARLTNELLESLKADRDAVAKEKADIAEAERKAKEAAEAPKAPTAAEVSEALIEAELTKSARARVLKAVEGGADLAEAIQAEVDVRKEVLESAGGAGAGHFEGETKLTEADRASKAVSSIFG